MAPENVTPTETKKPYLLGYARVSTTKQDLERQVDALTEAGVDRLFQDKATGANTDRPGLTALL